MIIQILTQDICIRKVFWSWKPLYYPRMFDFKMAGASINFKKYLVMIQIFNSIYLQYTAGLLIQESTLYYVPFQPLLLPIMSFKSKLKSSNPNNQLKIMFKHNVGLLNRKFFIFHAKTCYLVWRFNGSHIYITVSLKCLNHFSIDFDVYENNNL